MSHGKLEHLGSAEDLYKRPVSRFVAGFIGKCNFIEGRVAAPGRFEAANGQVLQFKGSHAGGAAALCFRPEHAVLGASGAAGSVGNSIAVTVKAVTYLGPVTEYDLVSDAGDKLLVSASSTSEAAAPKAGDKLSLGWRVDDAFVVD
jgi:ABC-type Fe3+/spermidine/putrescine transport system ATPase subunit